MPSLPRYHAAGALSWRIIDEAAELEALEGAWQALLGRSSDDEPTLSPLWMRTWWRIFGAEGGRSLRFGMLHDGPRLVAVAPLLGRLHWYRPGVPFRRLELLASGEDEADEICSEYLGLVAERGAESIVADAFADALEAGAFGSWDELVLPWMNGEGALPRALTEALARRGASVDLATQSTAPYVPLPASWESYLAALPSSRRYLVRRSLRDFDAWAGSDSRLEVARTRDDLERGKRILVELHAERWRGAGRPGVFGSARFAAFHDAVLPALLDRGALDLSWISVRGEPVSVLYNLVWNGKVYFYQGGRRMDLPRKLRPGIVMHAHAIRRAIDAGHREYDFLAGRARYKLELALAERPLIRLRATRTAALEAARRFAERGFDAARSWLRTGALPGG